MDSWILDINKICFHYETNLSELIFLPTEITRKPSFLMISRGIKVNQITQIYFIMKANFGNNY